MTVLIQNHQIASPYFRLLWFKVGLFSLSKTQTKQLSPKWFWCFWLTFGQVAAVPTLENHAVENHSIKQGREPHCCCCCCFWSNELNSGFYEQMVNVVKDEFQKKASNMFMLASKGQFITFWERMETSSRKSWRQAVGFMNNLGYISRDEQRYTRQYLSQLGLSASSHVTISLAMINTCLNVTQK